MPRAPKNPPPPPTGNNLSRLIDEIGKLDKESLKQLKQYINEITGN